MRMMSPDAVPRMKTIGILSGCAVVLFIVSAWLILGGGPDTEMYSFPPLLIGMVLLFMALALLALRAINRRQDPTPPPTPPGA
jgi:heme/copper-type cytochrome/quinol oxidase subunit 1